MMQCPRCGFAPLGETHRHCPNCGAAVAPGSRPEPDGNGGAPPGPGAAPEDASSRPAAGRITKSPLLDGILGILAVAVLVFLPPALSQWNVLGVPFFPFWIAVPVLYSVLRRTLPAFARGIGCGMLALFLLLLGALVQCSRQEFR